MQNCTYTYKGKQYSESELKDLLLGGELKSMVKGNAITLDNFLFLDDSKKEIVDIIAKVTNKKELVSALQSVFSLPNNQAEAVAKIYDAAAQGMVNLGIYKTKDEYYKNSPLFIKPSPETNFVTSDNLLQGEEPLIRSLFEIGHTFDTEVTARERFNIPALKKIGSGSDRDVYDIGDGKVVKIAKTARGLEQNIHEKDYVLIEQGVLPRIYETGLNYVVVEKVDPATSKNSRILELLKSFKDIDTKMFSVIDTNDVYGIFDSIAPLLKEHGISDTVLGYDMMWGDFRKQSNWGVRDGQLVHIDGGTFAGNNLIHQYKGKTNLEDADFKEIYQRSKELKSQFKDRDKNTMYQIIGETGISNIDGAGHITALLDTAKKLEISGEPSATIDEESLNKSTPTILNQSNSIGQVLSNVVKGFELNQVDGFNMSFKSKKGVATPALARRINQWLQQNGYDNVMFTYESTYGTLNPLYKEDTTQGRLFQNNKFITKLEKYLTNNKLIDIINYIEKENDTDYSNLKYSIISGVNPLDMFFDIGQYINNYDLIYKKLVEDKLFTVGEIELFFPVKRVDIKNNFSLNQNAKGAIDLNERIIYALSSPDVSTPLHEFAHLWLNDIENAARTGNKQAQNILDIFENFSNSDEAKVFFQKHFGSGEFDPTNFKFRHELFARGFERYIADNQAPKSVLEQIFEMFKQWLIEIYNGITGSDIDIQLNDKMKSVYDQILGKKITAKQSKKVLAVEPTEPVSLEGKIETSIPITSNNITTFENLNIELPSKFEGRVFSVPLSEVQYEEKDSKLVEREEDIIESKGVISPIVSTLNADGSITVKEGAERLQAMKNVGYKNIAVIFENEDNVPFVKSSEKVEEVVTPTEDVVKENTPIIEPIAPIKAVEVQVEEPKQFSKNEAAVQSVKKLIPFDKVTKESKGIKTFDTVEFKGKTYVVSNIDDEGFLSLVSSDIVVEKNGSLFYTKQPTRNDIQISLPEMVKIIKKEEPVEAYKFDPVINVAKRIQQIFPQIKFEFGNYQWSQAGRFENGKVKLNKRYFNIDTPIHEFLHPFVLAIKITNPQLYSNLLMDLQSTEGRSIVKEIINDKTYSNLSKDDILDEAVVRIMSKNIVDVFDNDGNINEEKLNEKRNSFIDSLKELFSYLMDLIFGRLKNTGLNNFINKMNSDTALSGKYLFKVAPLGTTRSKIDTVVLANKTVIYLNPKYFTEITIVDNLFYDIQQDISDEDYNQLLTRAKENIKIIGSENKTNPVTEIKYKKSTNQVIVKKFSNTTGKIQQEKTRTLDSVEDLMQYITPEEYEYFITEYNKSSEDIVSVVDINMNVVSTKNSNFIKSLTIRDIPINLTIGQLSDFIITQSAQIDYTEGEMDAIGELTAFSSKAKVITPASDEVQAAIKRLEDRVRNLKDTGDRRIFNDRLSTTSITKEANALKSILENEDQVTALLDYIRQGIVSLEFAVQNMNLLRHDFYEKINSGKITPEEVNEFNRKFRELSTYYSYYSNISYLVGKFEDLFYVGQPKTVAKEELDRMQMILGKVSLSKEKFQTLVLDMTTEWLFPYYYSQMNVIADRNKNLPSVISKKVEGLSYLTYGNNSFTINKEALKKHLRNQLIRSEEDASNATYLLGSTITSRDPVNSITSMVLTDAIYENDEFTDRLWVTLNIQYEKFLKEKGLPDNEKELRKWYKDNYLRKALSYEKTGRNDDGSVKYEYIERYAYHEDKFYDLLEKDLRDYAKSLPTPTTAEEYTFNRDKISDRRKELEKSSIYNNPKYNELIKDEFYSILYKNYKYSNNFFGNNGLKYGIIGQVNAKVSPTDAIKGGVKSIADKAKEINQEKTLRGKVKNIVKSTTDYLFDDNENIDNIQYNFDESLYRNIRTSTLIPIENEEDLELLLHENLMVFTKDGLKYSALRDIQSNIDNLKYLIQGNPSLGINPRKVISTDKSGNIKWFNFIKLPKNKENYENKLNDQLVQNINDVVYGEAEKQSYLSFGQSTDEKGNKVGGVSISLNNIGKNLGFGTALLNMSGNLLAMSRNMTIGNVTNIMEAVGSRYVSGKDYRFAVAEYTKQIFNSTNGIIADAFSRKKSKVAQMALLYDAIQGEYRDKEGRVITENFTRKYYSKSSWFLLNHAAEHQIQLTMMIALMKGKMVEVADGSKISLWDAYSIDKNGLYFIRKDIKWSKDDVTNFRKEMHSILRELNGNYSELHKAVLQRSWWGKLLMIYRKYIYSQVRSRFGGFRMDYERGDIAYGYFRLFTKQLVQDIRELGVGQALQNIGKNLKSNDEKTYLNYATRKTVFELSSLAALFILIKALAPDDDKKFEDKYDIEVINGVEVKIKRKSKQQEKISKLNAYALLWMNSLYSDLGSYTFQSLAEFGKQIKSPSASNITLTKVTALADQIISDMVNGELETYDQDGYGYEKGDSKLGAKFEKLIPIGNQILRLRNPEQQLQFFSLIGKRVRTND